MGRARADAIWIPAIEYRIEEHGFHVWMGFYDNAFEMIKQAYTELARKTGPFRSWTDAFKKHSLVIDRRTARGSTQTLASPIPGRATRAGDVVSARTVRVCRHGCSRSCSGALPDVRSPEPGRGSRRAGCTVRATRRAIRLARASSSRSFWLWPLAEYFLRLMEMKVQGRLDATPHAGARAVLGPLRQLLAGLSRGVRTLVELLSAIVAAWGATTDAVNLDEARRMRIFLDLSLAILRGILVDDIIAKGFDSIDHLEFKDWLRQHNARPESADSAIINSIYDGNFSFAGGDRTKPNFRGGSGASLLPADLPRLQGSPPLQDAGWHGRRRHRPAVSSAEEARGPLQVLPQSRRVGLRPCHESRSPPSR